MLVSHLIQIRTKRWPICCARNLISTSRNGHHLMNRLPLRLVITRFLACWWNIALWVRNFFGEKILILYVIKVAGFLWWKYRVNRLQNHLRWDISVRRTIFLGAD